MLPNFLVGRILGEKDPEAVPARDRLLERIAAGAGVSPLGVGAPTTYWVGFNDQTFGIDPTLRCPYHLDDGRCGIWRHRESICATWYCKHDRGAVGHLFWRALHDLLEAVEQRLARWCVTESGLKVRPLLHQFVYPKAVTQTKARREDRAIAAQRAEVWGHFYQRQHEFYLQSAERVAPLAWKDVLKLGGRRVAGRAERARRAFEELLSNQLPAALCDGDYGVFEAGPDRYRLLTYRPYDPIDLPKPLVEALPLFDGRPTNEAVRALSAERNLKLSRPALRRLVDFGVLVPVASLTRKRAA
jgi:hypothetical protein